MSVLVTLGAVLLGVLLAAIAIAGLTLAWIFLTSGPRERARRGACSLERGSAFATSPRRSRRSSSRS